jgi:hypothetical protein
MDRPAPRAVLGSVFGAFAILVVVARTETDRISLAGVATTERSQVFVRGSGSDGCVTSLVVPGTGPTVDVPNFLPAADDCLSEVAAFSAGHVMRMVSAPAWTDGADVVPIDMHTQSVGVRLNVWLASKVPTESQVRFVRSEIVLASALFKRNRVGISFQPVDSGVTKPGDARFETIGDGCAHAASLRAAGSPLYQKLRLNVYFVTALRLAPTDPPNVWRGYNCYQAGAPNIIYISLTFGAPTTLAHEIGHALSLTAANGHTGTGAVTLIPGFTNRNLMWTGLNTDATAAQDRFSLGQAYRMNVNNRSWVNAGGARAGPTTLCQANHMDARPCPLLALEWASP